MHELLVPFALVAVVLMHSGLVSGFVRQAPLSVPIVFLGLGLALGEGARLLTACGSMPRLTVHGDRIGRKDLWPEESDHGRPVTLPGGEVGILLEWWNAPNGSEWRWRVEFYNHR